MNGIPRNNDFGLPTKWYAHAKFSLQYATIKILYHIWCENNMSVTWSLILHRILSVTVRDSVWDSVSISCPWAEKLIFTILASTINILRQFSLKTIIYYGSNNLCNSHLDQNVASRIRNVNWRIFKSWIAKIHLQYAHIDRLLHKTD